MATSNSGSTRLKFLGDNLLYTKSEYCLQYLQTINNAHSLDKRQFLHFYWHGPLTAKIALCLKSCLATQNLQVLRPILWLDTHEDIGQFAENSILKPFREHVELRRLYFSELVVDTPLENVQIFGNETKAAARSDFFRLLVLYRYGGYYSDLDVIFLRDISILTALYPNENLLFQWSGQNYATNAFSQADVGSMAIWQMMLVAFEHRTCHPRVLFSYDKKNLDFLVLPVTFFSPLWLHVDKRSRLVDTPFRAFRDFFRPASPCRPSLTLQELFPGAFTYHWHNLWDQVEYRVSPAGQLNRQLDQILLDRFGLHFSDAFTAS